MDNIVKYIRSNFGFILALIIVASIALSPKLKSWVLRGLIKTGFYEPDVDGLKPKAVTVSGKDTAYQVPSVFFTSSNQETIDLADLRGKVVFLNFWATWCPPCIAEMPSVNSLFVKMKSNRNVVFLLVDADGNLGRSEAFMKKNDYELPVYIPAGSIPRELFSGSLPTTIILNKDGEVVFRHEGMGDYDTEEVVQFIEKLSL